MNTAIRLRLFLMMVLEYMIWGAWLPLIFPYLLGIHFSPKEIAAVLNTFPVAAIVAMFFSNQFADRNFAAEKFLAFSQLLGGLAMLGLAFTANFWLFFILMLIHCLLYVPTLSIVNSISFANLKDAKDYGLVRMGGTVGWVLAAWPLVFIMVDWTKVQAANTHGLIDWLGTVFGAGLSGAAAIRQMKWIYIVAGVASLMLAGYSLTLPHTPPKRAADEDRFAWLEAARLLKRWFVAVLWLVTFLDAFVINAYFNWVAIFLGSPEVGIKSNWITAVMSIGQIAEVLAMAILGKTLRRFGWRWTMIFGIFGHVVRFAIFAYFPRATGLIIAVMVIHGICYAFFFAAVYIFVDEYFPKDVRASAQGLFNVMILGVGVIAANTICPWMLQQYTNANGVTDFQRMFQIAGAVALGATVILALFFHPPRTAAPVKDETTRIAA